MSANHRRERSRPQHARLTMTRTHDAQSKSKLDKQRPSRQQIKKKKSLWFPLTADSWTAPQTAKHRPDSKKHAPVVGCYLVTTLPSLYVHDLPHGSSWCFEDDRVG